MRLDDLGGRICVLGPSGSGKSTLATAIGRKQHLTVVHLDQLRHLAGTQWELRPDDEFAGLHDAAIRADRWVVDGNYSKLVPERLARATGVILLDISTIRSLTRYVRRSRAAGPRVGGLDGSDETVSREMISYIVRHNRANRLRRREMFDRLDLPKVMLTNPSSVTDFYRREGMGEPWAT